MEFEWFLEPPKWLSWLGVLALAAALMVLPQIIWGRPRLKIKSAYIETGDTRMATFEVFSAQLVNPVLRSLGVFRRSVSAVALVTLVDARTNQLIATWAPEIKSGVGQANQRMILEPSELGYQIFVAATSLDGTSQLVPREGAIPLQPGVYRTYLSLPTDHRRDIIDYLNVGTKQHELHWESTSA